MEFQADDSYNLGSYIRFLLCLKPVRFQCYRITHVHNYRFFRSSAIMWKIIYFILFGHIQTDFVIIAARGERGERAAS